MSNQEPCCEFCLPEYSYIYDKEYSVYQSCFPTGTRFCNDGFDYCNETPNNGDCDCCGPRGRCCIDCYICLSHIGLTIDIITIPFRMTYFSYLQCKNCLKCKKETQTESYAI